MIPDVGLGRKADQSRSGFSLGQGMEFCYRAPMERMVTDALIKSPGTFDVFHRVHRVTLRILELGLYPPLPVNGEILVWGFHVVEAAHAFGHKELMCRHVQGSHHDLLSIALELEDRTGSYSVAERAAIAGLVAKADIHDNLDGLSRLITGGVGFFKQMRSFSELPSWMQGIVAEGKLDIKHGVRFATLPRRVCEMATTDRALSFSQVRLFLTYVQEAGTRDGLGADALADRVSEILAGSSPLEQVRTWRYPILTKLEGAFEDVRNRYLSETGITLKPPDNFEGDSYAVSFSFRNRGDLTRRIDKLKALKQACDELERLL